MRSGHTSLLILLTLLLAAAVGCSSESPATALILVTDLDPALEDVDRVQFAITAPGADMHRTSEGSGLPAYVTLQHTSGAPLDGYGVVVSALRNGQDDPVATLETEVAFAKGQTRMVELHLTADCRDTCIRAPNDIDYGNWDGMPPGLDASIEDAGVDASDADTRDAGTGEGGTEDAGSGLLCVGEEICADGDCSYPPDSEQDGDACGKGLSCSDGVCGGEDVCTESPCQRECGTDVASCLLDCGNVGTCEPLCDGTMSCTMDCSQTGGCSATCRNGARCLLRCNRPNCSFAMCTDAEGNAGSQQRCPSSNRLVTCNGAPCP